VHATFLPTTQCFYVNGPRAHTDSQMRNKIADLGCKDEIDHNRLLLYLALYMLLFLGRLSFVSFLFLFLLCSLLTLFYPRINLLPSHITHLEINHVLCDIQSFSLIRSNPTTFVLYHHVSQAAWLIIALAHYLVLGLSGGRVVAMSVITERVNTKEHIYIWLRYNYIITAI
jgi:hypothetical protein